MEQTGFRPAPKQVDMAQFDNVLLNQGLSASIAQPSAQ